MNKYSFSPILFIQFSGKDFLKKTFNVFFLLFLISLSGNANAQWVTSTLPVDNAFDDVIFINNNTGWVSQPYGGPQNIFRSTDGGANWTDCSVPTTPAAIHFVDENTGFAFGSVSYKTTNGGLNWASMGIPGQFVSFVNNLTGWNVISGGTIRKTTDGRNTWSSSSLGHISIAAIYFLNASTGWVISEESNIVLKTTNGGDNWNSISLTGFSAPYFSINFSDENNGRILGNNLFLKTTNGGLNWFAGTSPANQFLDDQYFLNTNTGWVTSRFGGVLFTSNGGSSWIQQPTGVQTFACSFTPQGVGFIVGSMGDFGTIAKTTNGGFTFSVPTDLTATGVSTSQINLSWTDNSTIEDKFIIERSPNAVSWTVIDSVDANVTTYSNTGLTFNTGYFYRVRVKKMNYTGSPTSPVLGFTLLDSPTLTTPGNNYLQINDSPTLAWNGVTGATQYHLIIATDTGFTNVVYTYGEAGMLFKSVPPGILQNSTRYYWKVRCANSSTISLYSPYRLFTVQYPDYGNNISSGNNLYYFANSTNAANPSPSKPEYIWKDTTGSINLILNGVLQVPVSSGGIDDGRFDLIGVLPVGNSIRYFGTDYQNLYIGTNGIIGFTAFQPNGGGFYQPASSLPQGNITNAIFPFWKDLNFGDPDVPENRLCYKVTSNEIIITYMKAPNYNNNTVLNEYVSFQVVIRHAPVNSSNSNIKVQFNYDETGSSFITKYNSNTLAPHTIGLQASNSSSQILQYRYVDITPTIVVSGPMFGSNLAVEFGPNVNLLPVNLASFTSIVNANNVKLNWSTSSEENNAGFDVERQVAGGQTNNWEKIGFVSGSGNSNEMKNYSFEDRNINSGIYKYRLKQIDYNGNFEYHFLTGEVSVGIPDKYNLSQNFPNPFNPVTKINFEIPSNTIVKLHVFDVTGKLVSELINKELQAGYHTIDFNGANLSSGIYFYRLVTNNFTETKKMVLMK